VQLELWSAIPEEKPLSLSLSLSLSHTALVEEIYKAQRERDQAVMARLRLANEERDEALLRAKKLQEATLEYVLFKPLPKQTLSSHSCSSSHFCSLKGDPLIMKIYNLDLQFSHTQVVSSSN